VPHQEKHQFAAQKTKAKVGKGGFGGGIFFVAGLWNGFGKSQQKKIGGGGSETGTREGFIYITAG